jgi:subtilisin-like proprotein convertase family protein
VSRRQTLIWLVATIACVIGVVYWLHMRRGGQKRQRPGATPVAAASPVAASHSAAPGRAEVRRSGGPPVPAPGSLEATNSASPMSGKALAERLKYRLRNTSRPLGELVRDDHAVLLENALIDTTRAVELAIPQELRAAGDPGSYIVQAKGALDDSYRALLQGAGAEVVSYIPNNAYLVRASVATARELGSDPRTQLVLPYEPYYKLSGDLLGVVMEKQSLPGTGLLNVVVFPGAREAAVEGLKGMGAAVVSETGSPFGPVLTVAAQAGQVAGIAGLAGVESVGIASRRAAANDLSRARVGVAADSVTPDNYMNLSGAKVLVQVNDTGISASHPDLGPPGRVIGFPLTDPDGHGTEVAGIIAGNGTESMTVTNTMIGSVINNGTASAGQFRGMAPSAHLYAQPLDQSDFELQRVAGQNQAQISNNSWNYGNQDYDIFAASYDAAVRDTLPETTGPQPVTFVFSAGNAGSGNDNGLGGAAESIESPATAKNVITVGALEQPRGITNDVVNRGQTNQPWAGETSSDNEVASFSSRGNVGIGVEGDFGRFKPDVVAPGVFVVSTRSRDWDTNAYFHPTNYFVIPYRLQIVQTNSMNFYSAFVPYNGVGLTIAIISITPTNISGMPIYVKENGFPSTNSYDLLATNFVSIPPDLVLDTGRSWFFSVGNPADVPVEYDMAVVVASTNDVGDYYAVLQGLDDSIGMPPPNEQGWYRYETGTSMAAADVSGLLALMDDFFTNTLRSACPSPALLKAMLINGSRTVNTIYDLQVRNNINFQGWGLPSLPQSLPISMPTNAAALASGPSPVLLYDQSPTNALATGESRTLFVKVDSSAQQDPLRVTVVWTDPPGNPVASVKLVNSLELVVTNLDTGDVFFGNDIGPGANFNFAWDTNNLPTIDVINNVQEVNLAPNLATNYSITVLGRRVNVNAVTTQTNEVSQDYALVISSDSQATNALSLSSTVPTLVTNENIALVTYTTNMFAGISGVAGSLLLNQHVGANFQLLGTNTIGLDNTMWGTNGAITLGVTNQWHFYVLTNPSNFQYAAFATFLPLDLSATRMGVTNVDIPDNATRFDADIDLYVSTNSALTNLDPVAVSQADKSLSLGGTELIVYTNSFQGATYYVGVKAEDQQAAEYAFLGVFSQFAFSTVQNGVESIRAFNVPAQIPDGSPELPGVTQVIGIGMQPVTIQRVVVTNTITHQNRGDLLGNLSHNHQFAVLNNHTFGNGNLTQTIVYEDNGQNDIAIAQHTDGPGSLINFMGGQGEGVWLLSEVDNALTHTGQVDNLWIRVDPQFGGGATNTVTIQPNSYVYFVIDVPPEATNLLVNLVNISATPLPVGLFLRLGDFPTATIFDNGKIIPPPAGSLSVSTSDLPPLRPGRYYLGVYNPSYVLPQTVEVSWILFLNPNRISTVNFASGGPVPIADDAVSYSTITISNIPPGVQIAQADVAVAINHPRVSDLVLTLISPTGKRIMLFENRGANTANLGTDVQVTNYFGTQIAGGQAATTNVIGPVPTSGTLYIDYDFYTVPDSMDVYYDGVDIFSTGGLVSGAGTYTIPYGPGTGNTITIVMNQNGNPQPTTQWIYTPRVVSDVVSYFTFTDDTNLTDVPVKFASTPYNNLASATTLNLGDFDPPALAGDYTTGMAADGWTVLTNQVSVVNDPANAYSPPQFLALGLGTISNTMPVVPGDRYNLSYAYRGPGIVSWWRGETNANDYVGGNNGTFLGPATFTGGEVGQAFSFSGTAPDCIHVPYATNLLTPTYSVDAWINPTAQVSDPISQDLIFGQNFGHVQLVVRTGTTGVYVAFQFGINILTYYGVQSIQQLPIGQFSHVAGTWDGVTLRLYINGVLDNQSTPGATPVDSGCNFFIGGFNSTSSGCAYVGQFFQGAIDELSYYGRALSPTEIQAIYALGHQGKFNPDPSIPTPQNLAQAQVALVGISADMILGANANWQVWNTAFTPITPTVPLLVTGIEPGMLMDSFTLSQVPNDVFVLGEESLQPLVGDSPAGTWTLEVRDDRIGATNSMPPPQIASWQMQFVLSTNVTGWQALSCGLPVTNTIAPCTTNYYTVDVPFWVTEMTNTLLFASGPLNVWFNQNTPPTGNPANGDFELIAGSIPASVTLSPATIPPLVPGARYYLAVENPCGTTNSVTYAIQVGCGIDVITLTNMVPYTNSNPGVVYANDYYAFGIPTNAARAQFEIDGPTGDIALAVRKGLPPPTPYMFDYFSDNPGTNDELIVVLTNSLPVPLTPGDWYLNAINYSGGNVTYSIIASWWPVTGRPFSITNVTVSTNDFCVTWESLPGVHYYIQGKVALGSGNWTTISPTITATGYSTTYCVPLPSPYNYFRVVEGIVIYNPGPVVTVTISVTGVLLEWDGPVNAQYQVQWAPALGAPWTTLPNIITSTTGHFSFVDDGSLTGGFDATRFYRVVQLP